MKIFFFTFSIFCLLLNGCLTNKEYLKLEEPVRYCLFENQISYKLILNPDSSFVYFWKSSLSNGNTEGQIKFKNNYLILNSSKVKLKANKKLFIDSTEINKNFYLIKTIDNQNNLIPFVNCDFIYSNDTIYKMMNAEGICKVKINDSLLKINFSYIGYESKTIKIDTINQKVIYICLKKRNDNYIELSNKIKIKGDKLIFYNNKGLFKEKSIFVKCSNKKH